MTWTALPLASGDVQGAAYNVSADGSTIVGYTGSRGCYWTNASGPTVIATTNDAFGVSSDGSVIAGNRSGGGPYRWTAGGGVFAFGTSADGVFNMSSDGSTIVGSTGSPEQACFWNASGTRTNLGFLPGHNTSRAMAASADGFVVVGFSYPSSDSSVAHGFRWTAAGGMADLGMTGRAFGVSGDGTLVVGGLASGAAFRWTSAGGTVTIPGMNIATAVSGDGTTIIGSCPMPEESSSYLGYWTAGGGIVVPAGNPTDPGDVNGAYPDGVSADGKTMVGFSYGTNPLPWLFMITTPVTLRKLAMDDVNCTTIPDLSQNLVFLEWSDDRAHSWSNPVGQPMGEAGEYRTSLQWSRLGMARDRTFRISWSVPTNTALQGCWFDAKPGLS